MIGEVDAYFDIWFGFYWLGPDPEDPDLVIVGIPPLTEFWGKR